MLYSVVCCIDFTNLLLKVLVLIFFSPAAGLKSPLTTHVPLYHQGARLGRDSVSIDLDHPETESPDSPSQDAEDAKCTTAIWTKTATKEGTCWEWEYKIAEIPGKRM